MILKLELLNEKTTQKHNKQYTHTHGNGNRKLQQGQHIDYKSKINKGRLKRDGKEQGICTRLIRKKSYELA